MIPKVHTDVTVSDDGVVVIGKIYGADIYTWNDEAENTDWYGIQKGGLIINHKRLADAIDHWLFIMRG